MKDFKNFLIETRGVKKTPIVFTVGRFQPPTIGHAQLINKVVEVARKLNGEARVYPTYSHDRKKNPLTFAEKVRFMAAFFPHIKIMVDKSAISVYAVAKKLSDQGYTNVTLVVGSDRVNEFKTMLSKYIKPKTAKNFDPEKNLSFTHFNVVSAGDRDPDDEGVSGVSGSKMREYTAKNEFVSFKRNVPDNRSKGIAKDMFQAVKRGLGLHEEINSKAQKGPDKMAKTLGKLRQEWSNGTSTGHSQYSSYDEPFKGMEETEAVDETSSQCGVGVGEFFSAAPLGPEGTQRPEAPRRSVKREESLSGELKHHDPGAAQNFRQHIAVLRNLKNNTNNPDTKRGLTQSIQTQEKSRKSMHGHQVDVGEDAGGVGSSGLDQGGSAYPTPFYGRGDGKADPPYKFMAQEEKFHLLPNTEIKPSTKWTCPICNHKIHNDKKEQETHLENHWAKSHFVKENIDNLFEAYINQALEPTNLIGDKYKTEPTKCEDIKALFKSKETDRDGELAKGQYGEYEVKAKGGVGSAVDKSDARGPEEIEDLEGDLKKEELGDDKKKLLKKKEKKEDYLGASYDGRLFGSPGAAGGLQSMGGSWSIPSSEEIVPNNKHIQEWVNNPNTQKMYMRRFGNDARQKLIEAAWRMDEQLRDKPNPNAKTVGHFLREHGGYNGQGYAVDAGTSSPAFSGQPREKIGGNMIDEKDPRKKSKKRKELKPKSGRRRWHGRTV